jgi:hypothetical protein
VALSEAGNATSESNRQYSPLPQPMKTPAQPAPALASLAPQPAISAPASYVPRTATAATDFNDRIDYVARKAQGVMQPSMPKEASRPMSMSQPAPPAATQQPQMEDMLAMQRQRFAQSSQDDKPNLQHRTLREFGEMNPQRSRLLNGKLFTKELIYKTQRGGIPEALQ